MIPTGLRSLPPHTELSVAVSDLDESYPLRSSRANFGARLGVLFARMRAAHCDVSENLISQTRQSSHGVVDTDTSGVRRYEGR